jgi:hypothetical protein
MQSNRIYTLNLKVQISNAIFYELLENDRKTQLSKQSLFLYKND